MEGRGFFPHSNEVIGWVFWGLFSYSTTAPKWSQENSSSFPSPIYFWHTFVLIYWLIGPWTYYSHSDNWFFGVFLIYIYIVIVHLKYGEIFLINQQWCCHVTTFHSNHCLLVPLSFIWHGVYNYEITSMLCIMTWCFPTQEKIYQLQQIQCNSSDWPGHFREFESFYNIIDCMYFWICRFDMTKLQTRFLFRCKN